jgi:HlyD family secretion protein
MFKWTSIILALAGVVIGVWTVAASRRRPPVVPPRRPALVTPFDSALAVAGFVEAASRNIRIAPPEPGLVTAVAVDVGDRVRAGQVLLQLDDRALQAELALSRAALEVARQELARLQAMPRQEDLPPLKAALDRAEAQLANARNDRAMIAQLHARQAATDFEMRRAELAEQEAAARRDEAQAQLDRLRAGPWSADLAVARAAVQRAEADLAAIQSRIDRLVVRCPIDGVVLKRFVEPGEYCSPAEGPAMQVGDLSSLHVRAQVDERDVPLLRPGARAVALTVSAQRHAFNLAMLRIEPLAVPKRSLTGRTTELVDTRVVEVLFRVEPEAGAQPPLYPGQLVDVYIDTAMPSAGAMQSAEPSGVIP